jgi:2-polyprenyl-6-methoxyphenol hydroxylase-like FAD-dependent oxidoreductase
MNLGDVMSERTTCVIAGGGPAGMVLGLLLARAGVAVTVLEKHSDFLRDFRGDTVHPSTIQLLDELGLGERFAALPQSRITEVAFPTDEGGQLVIGDLGRLDVPHPYIAMVPQWDLLDLLADAGRAEPTFTLRMDTEVTGLLREAGRVAGVRYRTADGAEGELHADLTVAADGRWSLVRREAGLRTREFDVPFDAWWFRLPRHTGDPVRSLTPAMRKREFSVVIPREGYYQVAYLGPKGADSRFRAEGIERFRTHLADLLPWARDRLDSLESMDDVKHLDVRLSRLHHWYAEGVLCIGDAAHAMSPIGGVGINLAVQDAVAAAHLLARPLRTRRVRKSDLARVQTRRFLPTVAVQGLQRLLHRAVVRPVMAGRRDGPPKPLRALLSAVPQLSYVPARLVAVGIRPEHAPEFARRRPAGDRTEPTGPAPGS